MKKLFRVIRLILVTAFIVASVLFTINALRITESRAIVERAIKQEVTYFSEGFLFENGFFSLRNNFDKFKAVDGVEYWIDTKTEMFVYLYNPNADENAKPIDENDAKQLAYDEAKKWDQKFFASDSMIERINGTEYGFFIFELNSEGYKTGRFIEAEVTGDLIKSLEMHTMQNPSLDYLSNVISEKQAINIAYSAMAGTETVLNKEDNHLIKTEFKHVYQKPIKIKGFESEPENYYWDIIIYEIDEQTILSQSETIDMSAKFICSVGALDGNVKSFEWEVAETDYCPLTGEVLTTDEDE